MLALSATFSLGATPYVLEFGRETQNVPMVNEVFDVGLDGVETACPRLSGETRYGSIPHRLYDETMVETGHFVDFAAVYPQEGAPELVVDTDHDGRLECDERVELIRHPRDGNVLFRSLDLKWNDSGPARQVRYRIKIPALLVDGEQRYEIEMVDVPVARWTQDGLGSIWVLYDGNHDGIFGGKFGDGILLATDGTGTLDTDPEGPNFHSYYEPIMLPWGTFSVIEPDPAGRALALRKMVPESLPERYRAGDLVPAMECRSIEGQPIRFGGEAGRYQVLFFWVASCGSCFGEAEELKPIAERFGAANVSVVGISMDESVERSKMFVRQTQIGWPNCFSGRVLWDNDLARRFEVDNPSDFVVLDPSGRVVTKDNGAYLLEELLEERIFSWEQPLAGHDAAAAATTP